MKSLVPQSIQAKSQRLNVRGRYYYVPIAYVARLEREGKRVILTGYDLPGFPLKFEQKPASIEGTLPDDVASVLEPDQHWRLAASDWSGKHTFVNDQSHEEVSVQLPTGSGNFYYSAYGAGQDRWLVVVAAGEWKVGPESYYGWLLIEKPHPPTG